MLTRQRREAHRSFNINDNKVFVQKILLGSSLLRYRVIQFCLRTLNWEWVWLIGLAKIWLKLKKKACLRFTHQLAKYLTLGRRKEKHLTRTLTLLVSQKNCITAIAHFKWKARLYACIREYFSVTNKLGNDVTSLNVTSLILLETASNIKVNRTFNVSSLLIFFCVCVVVTLLLLFGFCLICVAYTVLKQNINKEK